MNTLVNALVGLSLALGAVTAHADEVCSTEETRAANAIVARAKAAETAGNLPEALKQLQTSEARFCSASGEAELKRVSMLLGQQSEKAGRLSESFDYFEIGQHHDDAKRVGLALFRANPTDINWATNLLQFMRINDYTDGVAQIHDHARRQADALLAEEAKVFAIRDPHTDLLDEATSWLWLADDSEAAVVKKRALERADQYAALDYQYALSQALSYYERAGDSAKQATVKAKAKQLAAGLASGDRWGEAVELYLLADDERSAEELRARRSASAAATEAARQETFNKETEDLEKELGL
jgi:hypothetical protein